MKSWQIQAGGRMGGRIVVIGVLGGFSTPVSIPVVFAKNLHIHGISVGSREQFDEMCETIARGGCAR